ncbi:MAG: four helix bundle protein [Candidatus Liptonbacteria bacterium]|nr:four helix bundle protein [Candidatus Liptonbacteria bacterium]
MQNEKAKFKEDFTKRLIRFSVDIISFCEKLGVHRSLWSLSDQLIRSASSVGANVTEAKSSSSRRDYIKFFEIALKSANETKYWLTVVQESKPEIGSAAAPLYREAEEISKIIGSSVLTLKGKR